MGCLSIYISYLQYLNSLLTVECLVLAKKIAVHHGIYQSSNTEMEESDISKYRQNDLLSRRTKFLWFLFGGAEFVPTR